MSQENTMNNQSSTSTHYALLSTKQDPRFERGLSLLKDKRYEEAVEVFGDFLQYMVSVNQGNDHCITLAPIYYEYGNSLLLNAEQSADVFGDQLEKAKEEDSTAVEEAVTQSFDVNEDDREATNPEEEEAAPAGDLELAWEMLEVARVIYSRYEDKESETELARVYTRLGDLEMESGMFEQAKEDYQRALSLRKKWPGSNDTRNIADLHCCMAMSCIYQSTSIESDDDSVASRKDGLEHYVLAGKIIADRIFNEIKNCPKGIAEFITTILPKSVDTTVHGNGKAKAKASGLSLETLGLNANTATAANELKEIMKKENTKNDLLLEFIEIYTELKEKVDDINASLIDSNAIVKDESQSVTTIGFGNENKENSPQTAVTPCIISVRKKKEESNITHEQNVQTTIKRKREEMEKNEASANSSHA